MKNLSIAAIAVSISAITPAISHARTASPLQGKTIECTVDERATDRLVDQIVRRTPGAVREYGEETSIVESHLKSFIVSMNARNKIVGQIDAIGEGLEGFTAERTTIRRNGVVRFTTSYFPGYDSHSFKVDLNARELSATVREDFLYDCGDPTKAYAVYACRVVR